jgi:hypothetical protein
VQWPSLQDKRINAESFISTLAAWTKTIEPLFASELKRLIEWLSMPPEEAAAFIANAGFDPEYIDDEEWKGMSAFVVSSVLWSLYSFLRTPDDYWETIYTAISAGGDTDTTAAMAGAISGAYLGIGAIPSSDWISYHGMGLTNSLNWHAITEIRIPMFK